MLIGKTMLCTFSGATLLLTLLTGCGTQHVNRMPVATKNAQQSPEERIRVDRLRIDHLRCLQSAKIAIQVKVPAGRHQETVEVLLPEDRDVYRHCMEQAGWEVPALQLKPEAGD